jgi:hypothetical protein
VLRDREDCEALNGRMYGPCCAVKVRRGLFSFSCGECGGLFSEEGMVRVNMCRYCGGLW